MSPHERPPRTPSQQRPELVPRFEDQGYDEGAVRQRRAWIEERLGTRLPHLGTHSISGPEMRGNIENPIGAAQVPLGLAGPLVLAGEHARGVFYVPLATTEGALVRSYERGMVAMSRAGGAQARVVLDENRVAPVFPLADVAAAVTLAQTLSGRFEELRAVAEATTRHGRLLRIVPQPLGRDLIVHFHYDTGDASGMNMIVRATDAACRWIVEQGLAPHFYIFSGAESEKRPSGSLFAGGKGKKVIAGARLPARITRAYLHASPEEIAAVGRHTSRGHVQAGALGYNGHLANGLAALFIACGQDVANIANSAVGITVLEVTAEGDLYASVTLPSLTVGTVGGGTGFGTARECLEILGCAGSGHAKKLAEIVAATALAGELSMAGAIASGELAGAHEQYGRNRPAESPEDAA